MDLNRPNKAGKTIADYLPMAAQKLAQRRAPAASAQQSQVITKEVLNETIAILKKYKDGKRSLESRITDEEQWWKLRHWDVIRAKQEQGVRVEPTSAWLFNSITNKHADFMDNYPEPNVLPRERDDEQAADTLSSILPVILERNNYEETYSDATWYKLKHGVAAKGVFWNNSLEEGLGDVDISFIDILNIFWEPGITDIQDSRNLFIVALKDNDQLEAQYPQLKGKLQGQVIDVKEYVHDDTVDTSDKSVVVDWYYKRQVGNKTILHYCKFVGTEVLFSTEESPDYPNGIYDHGQYPVVFDVLFPEEGTCVGFGYIAIMKSPQMYIDKLSQLILENAAMSVRPRYFGSKSAGINEEEFLDWSKPIVHTEGAISEERLKLIEMPTVPANVLNILQMKIDELKETSSNRDVSQGSSSGGVTAAAAIAALQEAGNKTSRDMIAASYRSYVKESYLAIELIRQFYTEQRSFRITGDTGQNEYILFDNAQMQPQALPPAYAGQELERGYTPAMRKPIFDIVVKAAKRSPYSRLSQNELAKELYQMGVFNPQLAEQTLTLLDMMDFDGIEKVRDKVQQGQTLVDQLAAMQESLMNLNLILMEKTGMDALGVTEGAKPQNGAGKAEKTGDGKSLGAAQKAAQTGTMTGYGEKLAKRAKPSMD